MACAKASSFTQAQLDTMTEQQIQALLEAQV
jgi:hypothetical protein